MHPMFRKKAGTEKNNHMKWFGIKWHQMTPVEFVVRRAELAKRLSAVASNGLERLEAVRSQVPSSDIKYASIL